MAWVCIFRGFLYSKIEKISSPAAAVILSSVMFGIFHIFSGSIVQVIVTALLGVMFCLCRSKIKHFSTLSVIIAHGVYDALIVVLSYAFGG